MMVVTAFWLGFIVGFPTSPPHLHHWIEIAITVVPAEAANAVHHTWSKRLSGYFSTATLCWPYDRLDLTMPESNLSFLHLPYELREQIYQLVFSKPQSISLKCSSSPRTRQKQTLKPPVRYDEIISLRNACRLLRTETAPIFFTKMLFVLDLGMPRPMDGIYAFIHTFGIDNTNTIIRLGYHWRGQNPQYSTPQNESGVHFNLRQIGYWASKFPALD